jgi:hypothetical protein
LGRRIPPLNPRAGTRRPCRGFHTGARGSDPPRAAFLIPRGALMRYLLLWFLGVPIPVLIVIWLLWR